MRIFTYNGKTNVYNIVDIVFFKCLFDLFVIKIKEPFFFKLNTLLFLLCRVDDDDIKYGT